MADFAAHVGRHALVKVVRTPGGPELRHGPGGYARHIHIDVARDASGNVAPRNPNVGAASFAIGTGVDTSIDNGVAAGFLATTTIATIATVCIARVARRGSELRH
jgi:hypothetical protein